MSHREFKKMSFSISPGVTVTEIDLTNVIPAVLTTDGGIVGNFNWGPANQIVLISSENELVSVFGKPDDNNFKDWLSAAQFLSYANALRTVRVVDAAARVAHQGTGALSFKNDDEFEVLSPGSVTDMFCARWIGTQGNDIAVSVCPSVDAYTKKGSSAAGAVLTVALNAAGADYSVSDVITLAGGTATITVNSVVPVTGDIATFTLTTGGAGYSVATGVATSPSTYGHGATFNITSVSEVPWAYASLFPQAPGTSDFWNLRNPSIVDTGNDEIHVVVVDVKGKFTGLAGQVLERYAFASKLVSAKQPDGTSNYWVDVINKNSRYARVINANVTNGVLKSAVESTVFPSSTAAVTEVTANGLNGGASIDDDLIAGYALFRNAEVVNVSLLITSAHSTLVQQYVIQNICEYRKDCIAFISPKMDSVVNYSPETVVEDIKADRQDLALSSSYAVMDSNWKLTYDRYNDVNRWVPCNADVAGCCARTDADRDPWWSPAGLNRGQIKNVIRLAFNPDKAERDDLYMAGINPIVSFPGEGVVLFGDKTLLAKPSAFDRINVRRLFIVLEKAIAISARYFLFEFNDAFTRSQFKSMVNPYLTRVMAARGITDFRVVCDETNNTGEVIDHNQFVGDIYIKPARSINFINLNFIAVRTGVAFEEIVGKF